MQVDDKLCKLLHVDDIFRLLSVGVDDLGTTGHLLDTEIIAADSLQGVVSYNSLFFSTFKRW